ncbi:MAG: hypothetical protein K0R93_2032 [Anaerosolibacter sp.]|nr:hypothetical protein [Anaerosolibacter sp.]
MEYCPTRFRTDTKWKLFKGFLFIVLEIIIIIKSKLNEIILLSFQGNTLDAVEHTNYLWLLFYPSIYMFSIWDAFRDSGGCRTPYAFFPFVFPVYLGTIGIIYSSVFRVGSILLGPVWLPIICLILGVLVGTAVQHLFIRFNNKK